MARRRRCGATSLGSGTDLAELVNDFKKGFAATDGSSVAVNEAETEAMDEEDVEKESVKVRKPAPKK